jgi:hypothetical protein
MVELSGFDKSLFDVKRKKVNEYIKNMVHYGQLDGDEEKVNNAIRIVNIYLGKYIKDCNDEQEALELVDKVTMLRKQRIKLRRHIAAQVYAYAKQ